MVTISHSVSLVLLIFFFQAEDGIRDLTVTGVQTCALPISTRSMTLAGRNAPASSWASMVRRVSNSTLGRGVAALEGGLGMILANVRGRLRIQDFRLVALALARGDAGRRDRYERVLLEQGPDPLLDEPGLLEALLAVRSEEHTSELQSQSNLVCRLLLEKKKKIDTRS